MSCSRVGGNRNRLTNADWRIVFKAVKKVELAGKYPAKTGKTWKAIYENLGGNLKSRMTSDEIRIRWNSLRCEARGERRVRRSIWGVSPKTVKEIQEYVLSGERAVLPKVARNQGVSKAQLDEVKSGPRRSSRKPSQHTAGVTQQAARSSPQTSVGLPGKTSPAKRSLQNEVGLHEENEELSNAFFDCYDMEANGLAELIGSYALQTGKKRILEKIEQEVGIERFQAMLEEPSCRSRAPIEAAFLPAFSRFRKAIIGAVQSSTEALVDEVIKELVIKELRKEK